MGRNKTPNAIDTGNYIPRTLSKKQAADYVGVSVNFLDTLIDDFGLELFEWEVKGRKTGRYLTEDVERVTSIVKSIEDEQIYQENRIRLKEVMRV